MYYLKVYFDGDVHCEIQTISDRKIYQLIICVSLRLSSPPLQDVENLGYKRSGVREISLHFKIMVKVVHIALRLVILVIAPGLLHAKLADEEMGLEKNDEVKQMSPKELDSFIYNTYRMYQTLKNIAKM